MKITSLSNFHLFMYLKELSLVSCQIREMNGLESLGNTLETLRIVNCELELIDRHISKLRRLKILSLAENRIKEIRNLQKY
jgi:hypothetical protein